MHALCLVPVIIPRLFLTRVEDFCPVSILWFFSSFPSCSVAWELGRSSLLWEQAEPFLLELCVLLDGDHVHGGVRGHCLPHRVRQGLSGPFSSRRIGKLFQISVLSLKVWKPTNNVANCLTCYENLDWGFLNNNTSLADRGNSLTTCNAEPLETPQCLLNPKWPRVSGTSRTLSYWKLQSTFVK